MGAGYSRDGVTHAQHLYNVQLGKHGSEPLMSVIVWRTLFSGAEMLVPILIMFHCH